MQHKPRNSRMIVGLLVAGLGLFWAVAGQAQTLHVAAAASLKEAIDELTTRFAADHHCQADVALGASGTLAVQIQQGAPADVFISASTRPVDELIRAHLALPQSERDVAANRLVLIVPADFPNPPNSFDDLRQDRFQHIAVGDPKAVPAGMYAMQTLKSLGIDQSIASRLVMGKDVRQVLLYVVRGEADAGIVYATDALEAGNAVKVCAVADEKTHVPIVYPAVIVAAGQKELANQFLAYLQTPAAQAIFSAHGFSAPPAAATRPSASG